MFLNLKNNKHETKNNISSSSNYCSFQIEDTPNDINFAWNLKKAFLVSMNTIFESPNYVLRKVRNENNYTIYLLI